MEGSVGSKPAETMDEKRNGLGNSESVMEISGVDVAVARLAAWRTQLSMMHS